VSSSALAALVAAPAALVAAYRLVAHMASQHKLLVTVKDKAFHALAKLAAAAPFRGALLIASAKAAKAAAASIKLTTPPTEGTVITDMS